MKMPKFMNPAISHKTQPILKAAYLRIVSVILILTLLGLSTVGRYGVSWDEPLEVGMVKWNIDLITKGQPITSDLKYYGTVFNFTSELAFQAKEVLNQGLNYNPLADQGLADYRATSLRLYERIKVKHTLNVLISLTAYISVAGIVGLLTELEYAWLGPIVLALFPRFWGHNFFNPKDAPFAAMFTLGTFLGCLLLQAYFKADPKDIKWGINRLTLYSLLYGLLVGLVTGVRIGGFFLLFFVGATHLVISLEYKDFWGSFRRVLRFLPCYVAMFLAWAITTTIVYPSAWSNPIAWFIETLMALSKHAWSGFVLFDGQFISAHSLPWNYLPQWFLITIPGIFLATFLIGLLALFIQYRTLQLVQKACFLLLLWQIFFLPAIAILRQSTMYGAERQFLFVLPGIAVISATGLVWLYQVLLTRNFRLKPIKVFSIALLVVLLSPIVLDMVAIHPYEYIYFNRISGGLPAAYQRYETDYWALSLREGMEWINVHAPLNSTVLVGGTSMRIPSFFSRPDLVLADKFTNESGKSKVQTPDYYLAPPHITVRDGRPFAIQDEFPECPTVYSVSRVDTPLSIVKQCTKRMSEK